MLDKARSKNVYHRLVEAPVTSTGLPSAAYDLVITSLVDEHLAELPPLYREAHRLGAPDQVIHQVHGMAGIVMQAAAAFDFAGPPGPAFGAQHHRPERFGTDVMQLAQGAQIQEMF